MYLSTIFLYTFLIYFLKKSIEYSKNDILAISFQNNFCLLNHNKCKDEPKIGFFIHGLWVKNKHCQTTEKMEVHFFKSPKI